MASGMPPARLSWLGEDKAESPEQRKDYHQPLEESLVNFPKQPAPDEDPADYPRSQPEVKLEAG
jgi:hypothetical protein